MIDSDRLYFIIVFDGIIEDDVKWFLIEGNLGRLMSLIKMMLPVLTLGFVRSRDNVQFLCVPENGNERHQ